MAKNLLRIYALAVGVVLFVLGLIGFTSFDPLGFATPENLLHVGVGLLFFSASLVLRGDLAVLRSFVGGTGFLLLLGKGTIIATRWFGQGIFHLSLFGIVCLVAGACSLLLALLARSTAPFED